jgi:hypothetical protein
MTEPASEALPSHQQLWGHRIPGMTSTEIRDRTGRRSAFAGLPLLSPAEHGEWYGVHELDALALCIAALGARPAVTAHGG